MKKMMTWSLALASLTFAATSCSGTPETTPAAPASGAAIAGDSTAAPAGTLTYTCPMHPEVVSNQPGKCPKCHMDLVK